MVITPSFQVGDGGSIPLICSQCPLVYRLLHLVLVQISGVRFPGGQLKFLFMLITYYLICVVYCFYQLFSKYKQRYDGSVTSNSAELDTIMVIVMAWVLAPIDISLTWIRWVKEAELRSEKIDFGKNLLTEEDKDHIY